MLKRILLVSAFFVFAPPLSAQTPSVQPSVQGDTLTLNEVVERALRASPDMVIAESSVSNAQSAERLAVGNYLPSLSLTTNYGLASSDRLNPETNTIVSGSSDSYRAGVNAGLDIFTGGRRGAETRRANSVTEAAEATLVERRFATTLNAKRAYFDVAKARELVAVAEARLNRAQEGQVAAERRLQVGTATRSDVLRSTLEATNARNAVASAQAQYRTAAFALGRLVGAEGPIFARPFTEQTPRPLALSDDELARLALEQAPFVTSADANFESARASATAARAQYLPSLRLSGGYNWFNSDPTFNNGQLSWSMGLGINYPIFNGFTREDQIARAEATARNASATYADARRRARAELERVLSALRLAEEQVVLTRQAVEVAREDLRVQDERYKLGMTTILDRITSLVNVMDAERNEVAARYDYEIARAELEALIGRTL
ncbi:MAG TPA: TolC family protein [Longimicrobiales bacterium]|nr:TolC family protein [Longimicrobiales bacterium]